MTEQKEMTTDQTNLTTDNVVEVPHEAIIPKIPFHKTDIVLHHEIEIIMTEVQLLSITHVHDMIIITEILDGIVPLIDHTDHLKTRFSSNKPITFLFKRQQFYFVI